MSWRTEILGSDELGMCLGGGCVPVISPYRELIRIPRNPSQGDHVSLVTCYSSITIEPWIWGGDSLSLRSVEVILVKNKGIGKDISE